MNPEPTNVELTKFELTNIEQTNAELTNVDLVRGTKFTHTYTHTSKDPKPCSINDAASDDAASDDALDKPAADFQNKSVRLLPADAHDGYLAICALNNVIRWEKRNRIDYCHEVARLA